MSIVKKIIARASRFLVSLTLRAKYSRGEEHLNSAIKNCTAYGFGKTLDLGSGPDPRNPFRAKEVNGIDIRSYHPITDLVQKCDVVSDTFPFSDRYFDFVTAYDFLEHIPRVSVHEGSTTFPVVKCMNEIWRVLKMGGFFLSVTPCYPMKQVFQDPTHVNVMTEDTLHLYFAERAWARIYGYIGSFEIVDEGWRGSHYWCLMKKTEDEPLLDKDSPQR